MNNADVKIMHATVDDVGAVAEMFDLYRQFYDQEPDLKKCRNFIHKRITRSESIVLLAVDPDNGSALGFTQIYPTYCSVAAARIFVLYDLFVRIEARNRGIGRALMKRAGEHARAAGVSRIQLETHQTNKHAQHLYESLGYKKDEEFFSYALLI